MTAGKVVDNWAVHQGTKDQLPARDFKALNKVRLGLYKIVVHLFLCVQESIILLLTLPIRITHTTPIRLRDFCAIYIPPPTLPLYAIHHTTLVMTISCKG